MDARADAVVEDEMRGRRSEGRLVAVIDSGEWLEG